MDRRISPGGEQASTAALDVTTHIAGAAASSAALKVSAGTATVRAATAQLSRVPPIKVPKATPLIASEKVSSAASWSARAASVISTCVPSAAA